MFDKENIKKYESYPFFKVPESLVRLYGWTKAGYLSNLINKFNYLLTKCPKEIENGWFFATQQTQIQKMGVSEKILKTHKNFFVKEGILEIKRKYKRRTYFKINFDVLFNKMDAEERENLEKNDQEIEQIEGGVTEPNGGVTIEPKVRKESKIYILDTLNNSIIEKTNNRIIANPADVARNCHLDFLKEWNDRFQKVKGVGCHRSLKSKIINDADLKKTFTLSELLTSALKITSSENLSSAIKNYYEVITNSKYYYNYRMNFGAFLYSGLKHQKGFLQFIPNAEPLKRFLSYSGTSKDPWDELRKEFLPITEKYDPLNVFDEETKHYYGFEESDYKAFHQWYEIVEAALKGSLSTSFKDMWALECYLSGCFYHRRNKAKDKLGRVIKLMKVWKKLKSQIEERGFLKT